MRRRWRWAPVLPLFLLGTATAVAQDTTPPPTAEASSTGLPSAITWKFNFDAGWGAFTFGNSLYTGSHEGVIQDYGDNWMEGFAKPALSAAYPKGRGELYGKLSVVGERTYASPPPTIGLEQSSFQPEDLAIGWRSGEGADVGENLFDVVVGRAPYTVGHGMLIWDGAAEGGTRGGYWSNARKNFEMAAIIRYKPGDHTLEAFYLKKDDLPEHDTDTRLWGANYEYAFGSSTVGATYMKFAASPRFLPLRDNLEVFNLRAYIAPWKDLTIDFEYANERNHDDPMRSNAWTAQGAYEFSAVKWQPTFTYRYADFQGDDPATTESEAFDPLLLGFYDWGSWWQGEIAGEYFLSNSNLKSHLVRVNVAPNTKADGGVIFYRFLLDQLPVGITDDSIANEVDGYVDWKINSHFTANFILAWAEPKQAVQQTSGRTRNFKYGMVFLAYSY